MQIFKFNTMWATDLRAWKPVLVWGGSSAVCLGFFANLFSANALNGKWISWLRAKTEIASIEFFRFPSYETPRNLGGTFFVDAREVGQHVQYSVGSLHFWVQYGMFFAATLFVMQSHRRENYENENRFKQAGSSLSVLLVCFITFNLLFFYVDFVNDVSRSWIKTRFLEGPILTFLIAFGVITAVQKSYWQKRFILYGAVVWSIVPFVVTGRVSQWMVNLQFLISVL
jgi:hypothetical protein